MDKITLHNMKFYAYHGCEDFERQYGQPFEVDLDIFTNTVRAGQTDCLTDALDYGEVFANVKLIVECERFNLLEKLAGHIADCVLANQTVKAVVVRVRKPAVPLAGMLDWVQIEIRREQK
jgi:dihydroneopterin aldolase